MVDLTEFRHCDDYIDDEAQPMCLRKFLDYARSPAHGSLRDGPKPLLFARYHARLVRVTMASRLGDVGITTRMHQEYGYEKRVAVADLTDFSGEQSK